MEKGRSQKGVLGPGPYLLANLNSPRAIPGLVLLDTRLPHVVRRAARLVPVIAANCQGSYSSLQGLEHQRCVSGMSWYGMVPDRVQCARHMYRVATAIATKSRGTWRWREGERVGGGVRQYASFASPSRPEIEGVKDIIAVASGKGGVGKSTTAVNLAVSLVRECNLRVGLLDADVYGPSLPRLMNLQGRPRLDRDKKIIPMENYGVKCMSMGFLMEDDAPAVWRGPMVMSALEKLTRGVAWGRLDVMVVDMPPGTGDAQISISQRVPLSGAVIVSTPQDIALIDARRGANMFRKVDVPILGLIENMSYYTCPDCGSKAHIFGHGGARKTAEELEMEFLGEVPLNIAIRQTSDDGTPIVATDRLGAEAQVYTTIAKRIVQKLRMSSAEGGSDFNAAPRIIVE